MPPYDDGHDYHPVDGSHSDSCKACRVENLEKAARDALHKIRNKTTGINSAGRILGDEGLQRAAKELDQVADDLRAAIRD